MSSPFVGGHLHPPWPGTFDKSPGSDADGARIENIMKTIFLTLFAARLLAGCDNSDPNSSGTDTINSQPVDQNPQVDKDPTAKTSTAGDQQGAQPAQPANP
ncbi:hypothetical protein ACVDG8_008035 [Mesorhizobium sp. ORM8.1]